MTLSDLKKGDLFAFGLMAPSYRFERSILHGVDWYTYVCFSTQDENLHPFEFDPKTEVLLLDCEASRKNHPEEFPEQEEYNGWFITTIFDMNFGIVGLAHKTKIFDIYNCEITCADCASFEAAIEACKKRIDLILRFK